MIPVTIRREEAVRVYPPTWRYGMPTFPWWWFATRLWDRNVYCTWRHTEWWSQRWSEFTRLFYEAGMWFGVWETVVEGGHLWKDGRWRWAFWRTPWSVWQRKRTMRERYGSLPPVERVPSEWQARGWAPRSFE